MFLIRDSIEAVELNADRDRNDMAKLGVSTYFRKPSEYAAFMKLGELVKSLLENAPETPRS